MNVPEKIYIEQTPSGKGYYWDVVKEVKQNDSDIEYTRTDAFIEKACEVFCKVRCKGKPPRSTCTSLGTCKKYDDFVNYMKGE